jgi:uncharacterized integral membrane protein
MILIGFILVAAAVAAAIILLVQNAGNITVHALGWHWHVPAFWLAISGLAIMAVFVIGASAWRTGAARGRRIRRERRDLARENQRLSKQVESTAQPGPYSPPGSAPPSWPSSEPTPGGPPTSTP